MKRKINRRKALGNIVLTTGALSLGASLNSCATPSEENSTPTSTALKGNIRHSACRWCYSDISMEDLAKGAKEIGLSGLDLLKPEEWAIAKKYGIECSLATDDCANLTEGFNNASLHEKLHQPYIELIDKASEAGIKNVIVFSGNRNGISEVEGLENCAVGLDKLVKHAEKKNVTLVMELLNSKVDHKDYQCDFTPWGVGLVKKISSPNFKLLYDIYHMQIMEGDVIRTIRDNQNYIAHYHTGGVPGRNEINDTQELYYPAIMKAIVETGYKGFVAQEFIPTRDDKFESLRESIRICDV